MIYSIRFIYFSWFFRTRDWNDKFRKYAILIIYGEDLKILMIFLLFLYFDSKLTRF